MFAYAILITVLFSLPLHGAPTTKTTAAVVRPAPLYMIVHSPSGILVTPVACAQIINASTRIEPGDSTIIRKECRDPRAFRRSVRATFTNAATKKNPAKKDLCFVLSMSCFDKEKTTENIHFVRKVARN